MYLPKEFDLPALFCKLLPSELEKDVEYFQSSFFLDKRFTQTGKLLHALSANFLAVRAAIYSVKFVTARFLLPLYFKIISAKTKHVRTI